MGAQITDLLTSTVEISNLMSVLSVLAALLVMLVFLTRLIYQVGLGPFLMFRIDQFNIPNSEILFLYVKFCKFYVK